MKIKILATTLLILSILVSCGAKDEIDYSSYYEHPKVSGGTTDDPDDPNEDTSEALRVISFNVRYSTAPDAGVYAWDYRRVAVPAMVEDNKPTVMGVQELRLDQKEYLDAYLEGYRSIGVGRNDGVSAGEFMAIYFLDAELKLEDWGTFWLSETPNEPSKGWDAKIHRTATWARFSHISTNEKFYIFNTHLDHEAEIAPAESMKLIESKIAQLNTENLPVLLTGDFNKRPNDPIFESIKLTMKDARVESPKSDNKASFNNFGVATAYPIIDYIFCSDVKLVSFETIDQRYESVPFISDHYPIMATFEFIAK